MSDHFTKQSSADLAITREVAEEALRLEQQAARQRMNTDRPGLYPERTSKKIKRKDFSDRAKKRILDRTGGECAYCPSVLTIETMTIDHVYPLSKGGTNELANLVAACQSCNNRKKANVVLPRGFSGLPGLRILSPAEQAHRRWQKEEKRKRKAEARAAKNAPFAFPLSNAFPK